MNGSGASFSVATTVFVSLAICAVVSYGVFYYFKQRISVIEKSQMEQARVMQAFIARSVMHPPGNPVNPGFNVQGSHEHSVHKEVNITESGLIVVSSDSESESDSDESESSQTSESSHGSESDSDKWSIGDEIHQPDSLHEAFNELLQKKHIHIDNINIDSIEIEHNDNPEEANQTKKIISLNKSALAADDDANNDDDDDDDDDDDSSSSSDVQDEVQDKANFELKIGYKSNQTKETSAKAMHLNYGNMSVPALRQLAKERGLGGEDADLQKLKKKDLVQLLSSKSI